MPSATLILSFISSFIPKISYRKSLMFRPEQVMLMYLMVCLCLVNKHQNSNELKAQYVYPKTQ